MKALFLIFALACLVACSTTKTVVGPSAPAIDPEKVQVFLTPPTNGFQVVAKLASTSAWGLTYQQAHNGAVAQLKKTAAKLGANGIVIDGSENDLSGAKVSATAIRFSQQEREGNQ